jgi:hypothetical protein
MRIPLVVAVIFLTGCVTVDAGQCREAFDLGYRDAIMGLQRQDDLYGPLCNQQRAPLDTPQYVEGWLNGRQEYDRRTPHTE